MSILKNFAKNPKIYIIHALGRVIKGSVVADSIYLKILYKYRMGKKLNLNSPETFNEKLQWLKLYDRQDIYTTLVDKYEVKKYIADSLGSEYVIPTIGVWNNFDDINFDDLPNQFVLKCTHDSGGLVIVSDKEKFDKEAARKKLNYCLKRNYFRNTREWPYKNVSPRIIAEQYMENELGTGELSDYKLMCFSGKVKCSFTCTNRLKDLRVTFYDDSWNKMPFIRHYPAEDYACEKPRNYEKMVLFAEKLTQMIPFARVDFYEIKGRLYFGEITFYPGGGFEEFVPEMWDKTLGEWLVLPRNNQIKEQKDR